MEKLTNQELIEKLQLNISRHIKPYNLGDLGETENLINELISRLKPELCKNGSLSDVFPAEGHISE